VAAELDDEPVVLVGHDWGAPIASHAAIRYPDRVRAVANLSLPHWRPSSVDMLATFDLAWADRFFYILRFQEPGMIRSGVRRRPA
jgi:pimeloyl-ACP methyl ester carboxylesterase